MREYDKMIRGELYNPTDEELTAMRRRVRRLFYQYNNSEEDEKEKRAALLRRIFGGHGERLYCEPRLSASITASIRRWGKTFFPISTSLFWMLRR